MYANLDSAVSDFAADGIAFFKLKLHGAIDSPDRVLVNFSPTSVS
jgi:hypothetical protein